MNPPVFLAIPNYNMASQLKRLLPAVINRGYKHIYVLDDCSSDNSAEVTNTFKADGVSFVKNSRNRGAGATRNLILLQQQKGIVHFLDADVAPQGLNNLTASIIAAFERHPMAGAIGFRVFNPDKTQYDWNFGPRRKLVDGLTWKSLDAYERTDSSGKKQLLKMLFKPKWDSFWTYTHPDSAEHEQEVGAAVECNLAVRLEDFAKVGGFDAALRYHEIHSLACKLRSLGKTIWYVPDVPVIKHSEIDVRTNRAQEMRRAQWLLDLKRLTRRYIVKS